jgi:glycine/D-amino acid oxidase-like deaminating enzyme
LRRRLPQYRLRADLAVISCYAVGKARKPMGHVFISYAREDADHVDQLQQTLEAAGIPVWRDTADLWPGQDWRAEIRRAVTDDALAFIACFSRKSLAREKSYQRAEIALAIEQMLLHPPDVPWLIPVRFDNCSIPNIDIGGGRTMASIQRADLFGDRSADGKARLVAAVLRILDHRPGNAAKPPSKARAAAAALVQPIHTNRPDLLLSSPSRSSRNYPPRSADVVIIGSGMAGLFCAYSLIKRGVRAVTILESASSPGGRATPLSVAMLTRFTGHQITTTLADRSIQLYHELGPDLKSVTGIDVEFIWCGFSILGRNENAMSMVRSEYEEQGRLGISPPPELTTGRDINQLSEGLFEFPNDAIACHAERDGFVNISSLTSALIEYIGISGATILTDMPAVGIVTSADRVIAVRTPSGVIDTPNVVNAAGAWASKVSDWVDRSLPMQTISRGLVKIDLDRRFVGPIVECLDDNWYFRPHEQASRLMIVGIGSSHQAAPKMAQGSDAEIDLDSISSCKEYVRKWTSLPPDTVDRISPRNAWSEYRTLHEQDEFSVGRVSAHLPLFGDPGRLGGYYESHTWSEFGGTLGPIGGNQVASEIIARGEL